MSESVNKIRRSCFIYEGKTLTYFAVPDLSAGRPNVYTGYLKNADEPVIFARELTRAGIEKLLEEYEQLAEESGFNEEYTGERQDCIDLVEYRRNKIKERKK